MISSYEHKKRFLQTLQEIKKDFFHPDYTVAIGVAPIHAVARGVYHRLGITPDPEVLFNYIIAVSSLIVNPNTYH